MKKKYLQIILFCVFISILVAGLVRFYLMGTLNFNSIIYYILIGISAGIGAFIGAILRQRPQRKNIYIITFAILILSFIGGLVLSFLREMLNFQTLIVYGILAVIGGIGAYIGAVLREKHNKK
ncbi:MAG: hypothetical protein LBV69_02225 [Bacteroidales bacterium]|jgi:membrane associated rhomboid family serine protease|nr:hypothetical protein [Bacteroidales bacterium]